MIQNDYALPAPAEDALAQHLHQLLASQSNDSEKAARVHAALSAYWNARADGLCHQGAWECAWQALTSLLTY